MREYAKTVIPCQQNKYRKDISHMVKIISDSTCDLSPELIAKYDIDILPLHILLGEDEYEDGRNITPQQIYDWSDAHKTTPKTSAPSLAEAIDLFRSGSNPGLTMNLTPAVAASICSLVRTVPAPTSISGNCSATRRIDSSAASVRNVTSAHGSPPSTSAFASGTEYSSAKP